MQISKLENNIRNKLRKRRINPSDDAWNKLENKLDGEERKFKNRYWWMGIAASFLVGFLISWAMFFNQGTPKKNYLASAHQTKTNVATKPLLTKKNQTSSVKKSAKAHNLSVTTKKEGTKITTNSSQIAKVKSVSEKIETKQDGAEPTKSNKSKLEDAAKIKNELKERGDFKVAASSNIDDSKSDDNKAKTVTDTEVENLLQEARLKIKTETPSHKYQNAVSASALLAEVGTKKEEPLKERILKTIKDGLHKVGAMLASRY